MSRQAKIIWTVTEQADWYAAFLEGLKERDVPFPVTAAYLPQIMESAREALKVLKVERRREITSIDAIRGELAQRLIEQQIFPRDYLESLRRKRIADAPDPSVQRMNQLEELLALREAELADARQWADEREAVIKQLQAAPSPMEQLQVWLARTLAMALSDANSGPLTTTPLKQAEQRLKEALPQFERDRRRDPVAFTAGLPTNGGKPKFAVVADLVGSDKGRIHAEVSSLADLRYLDSVAKFGGLKLFNATGGRIVLWTDHAPHEWEKSLNSIGVSFHRHRGTLPALIQHLKETVEKTKGLK